MLILVAESSFPLLHLGLLWVYKVEFSAVVSLFGS